MQQIKGLKTLLSQPNQSKASLNIIFFYGVGGWEAGVYGSFMGIKFATTSAVLLT